MTINWKAYHKNEQLEDYNLRNYSDKNNSIILFNSNDLSIEGENINHLNSYLGELSMMYYVWKNNLKSEYVIISHYRRDITYIDYEQLDKNKFQFVYHWLDENNIKLKDIFLNGCDPSKYITNQWYEYLKENYGFDSKDIKRIENTKKYNRIACFLFASNWSMYCKICELIFGFIDKLFPNDSWKDPENIIKFREKQKEEYLKLYDTQNHDDYWIYYNDRYLVYIIENIMSIYLCQIYEIFNNGKYFEDTFICTDVSSKNKISDIEKFYRKNLKINPYTIYVRCSDDIYDKVNKYFTDNMWHFNKIQIIKQNEVIENSITLNIDEYIDLDMPIDYQNNKYIIRKL